MKTQLKIEKIYRFKCEVLFYKRNCDGSLCINNNSFKSTFGDIVINIKPYNNVENILFYPKYNCFIIKGLDMFV